MIFGRRRRKRIRTRHTARSSFIRHILRGLFLLLTLSLLGTAVHYVTRAQAFTIQTIEVIGGVTIDHGSIRSTVENELRGSYWRLIPHTFVLTYPHDAIVRSLAAYPRLREPMVERSGRTGLRVTFEEYIPHALLCGRDETRRCFFIDASGLAFEGAGMLSGGALIRYVDEGREEVRRGDTLTLGRLHAAEQFIDDVESELGLRVGSVVYTADGDIRFRMNGGGEFLVSGTNDLIESFENIRTVLEVDTYTDLGPGDFQYIDARFPPKIFVNDTPPAVATSTDETATVTAETL